MLRWLRRILHRWLIGEEPVSPAIEVLIDGQIQRVVAQAAVGVSLSCVAPSPHGARQRIVTEANVIDRRHFWRLWRQLGGEAVWEDGSPFRPDGIEH